MPRYKIANELRHAILQSSQREFAYLAGLNEGQLSRILHGEIFGDRVRRKITLAADILGVPEGQAVKSCLR